MENPKKSDAGAAVSEEYGLSKDRIARYLRIATLITPLLDCLDAKTLGFEAAYDISFVKEEMQPVIAELIVNDNCRIDTKKSILIHDYAKKGKLTEELLRQIITGEKNEGCKEWQPETHQNQGDSHQQIFGREQSRKEIEDTIVKALEFYFAQSSENPEQKVG